MAELKGVGIGEVEHHLSHGRYPRDLMQRLNSTDQMRFREAMVKKEEIEQEEDEEEEEIELNLGLSLGGRFGVDPPKQSSNNNNNNKLHRSSSMIAGLSTTTFLREDDAAAAASSVVFPLIRTSSLPMESEEEWRKRKELQSLRRMEAKRKRSEKQKNIKLGKERASLERNSVEEDGGGGLPGFLKQQQQQQQQQIMVGNGFAPPAVVTTPFGMPNWASSAHRGSVGSSGGLDENNSILAAAAVGGGQGYLPPSSQGSVGSHGSSSSAISEFECLRPVQGLGNCNEARSPSSVQSVPEQKPIATSASTNTKTVKVEEAENPSKKPRINENGIRESGMKVMEEMPCVSTKGDGPNGRRIEGFLYKYKKGEEVRIVCVCHGSFLTPAEFVKHAGGGDVAHPLRHIVVTPSPSFL